MWLIGLIGQHTLAIERDLINMGLRLRDVGSDEFTFHDLYVICVTNAGDSASLLAQSLNPSAELGFWGDLDTILLAEVADRLALIIWQNGGGKGKRPDPIERPGRRKEMRSLLRDGDGDKFGGMDSKTLVDPREWLVAEDPRWSPNYVPEPALPEGYYHDSAGRLRGPTGRYAKDPRTTN